MLGIAGIVALMFLIARRASMVVFTLATAAYFLLLTFFSEPGHAAMTVMCVILLVLVVFSIPIIRRNLITRLFFNQARKAAPSMSDTEREALEAGTVSWEGDLFSGDPDFGALLRHRAVAFTPEEQAFIDGPLKTLCRMLDEWEITHELTDLPAEVWTYIRENGFLGMIIPKRYGGLEFSATAQMSVLVTLYGRSASAATTVAVPNSLGPAELLLKYGTEEQKNYYLPRLADGREIPCFALTGPNAGSDAASLPDTGVVCRQEVDGKMITGIRLTWNKRYITLCPVATVIGLAFRLYDPENILGKGTDVGISCALIPADTKGVIRGRRHFPLNIAFMNGPTSGKDVFVPIDCLIGGTEMAGHGWRMLMECLSAGRAISLPSSASGGVQAAALACGAYARVRRQFNVAISQFEGIEEPLARIAGNAYLLDAGLTMACAAIDQGAKPAVAGAILKYHTTERARRISCDAMDIHGGKGICLGPNNYLGRGYQSAPIAITVEGANILTRCLIIFGQGAIRCHPYVFREMEALREGRLQDFDKAFWGHVGFVFSNLMQTICYHFTDGRGSHVPGGKTGRYFQKLRRKSANFALLSDLSMALLGGSLKRRESTSARLGDMLSTMYLASAVLKRFHTDGEPDGDLPLVHWSCQQLFQEYDKALSVCIRNYPVKWARPLLRLLLQPFGVREHGPSDALGKVLANILTRPNHTRARLTRHVFSEPLENCPLGRLEATFHALCAVEDLEKRVVRAHREGKVDGLVLLEQIDDAVKKGILDDDEGHRLREVERLRQQVIAVDDFSNAELARTGLRR
ncbi:acyl-CoA dehydrogenase [Legionella geestiana]|uniref:Acyl-coenzyme A dehydrogenase n=1 Tax=Legionella geestiana TaxID=45065 RepID=A0A0W0TS32_9GAMM|nr:acyl-CoA dehydrogenase [Legionella geestiana]KTC98320.1 acyl-CoA dehydrogenase [Legionella geestiana]QBS11367.1 acyl-CoA dehydrogenase [Legionella geestiana]QDQ38919.1 acyl-CoA dehydrogenase [Legionella geestiana]STX53979.1 oxidoreductase, acyl CoA dehydrogenase family [Legionella geestiana]